MEKICILIITLLFSATAMSQKPNPTIGKKEFEISLLYQGEQVNFLAGTQMVRRWSWKKYTKVGVGSLVGVQDYDPIHESDVVAYGALFGDIIQFIGKRQKSSFSGQIGHGIFKRKSEGSTIYDSEVVKHTAGMYYSICFNYRSIISKKTLMVVSLAYSFRNFKEQVSDEHYSPPSVEEYTLTNKYSGLGIRVGIIF